MDTSLSALVGLIRETIAAPQSAALQVMRANLPMAARWQALALVVVLSAILGQVSMLFLADEGVSPAGPVQASLIQAIALLMTVFGAHVIGRGLGGQGSFADALVLVAWLQGVMVAAQALQVVALLILPPVSVLIGVLSMVLFLWLLTNFVAVLHGFQSLGKVFAGIMLSAFALAVVLVVVLNILGIAPQTMV
jgi:hypothetical protein